MTILDADWNASDDPFVKPAPSFATTPDGWFSSGTNLSFLTVEARNVLSGVLDDEDRQVVVLAHDTNGSIERGAAFHNTADRLDESTAQWHPYRERSRNDEGDPIWFDVLACSLIVNDAGDDTCYLDLSFSSFPNNEYRIRITRFPIYYDNDLAQLILSLGSFLLGDLPIWDESGLGTFYQGRDFLDKDSFQAYSDREFSHRLRFIAKRGESINSMIADMLGQTPSLAAIRPSDTDDGKTSLHVYHPEELPVRSDVVLSSDSQTVTPHVISWELRQGIVNPTTGYNVTFGHYHIRSDGDGLIADRFLNNDFPLEYATGEDRFTVGYNRQNITKLEFPNGGITSHKLDQFGVLSQFPIWTKLKSQDEVEVAFDWYGLNFMPGDVAYLHIDGIGWDETNGERFIVDSVSYDRLADAVITVTFRSAHGLAASPVHWRDADNVLGSSPALHWPFLYSTENLRFVGDGNNPFGLQTSEFSGRWLNAFARAIDSADYGTFDNEHMTQFADPGAVYRPNDHADSVYGFPGVKFDGGGQQPPPQTPVLPGDALLWWVWNPNSFSTANEALFFHDVNGTDYWWVKTGTNNVLIEIQTGGATEQWAITPTTGIDGYVIVRFGGAEGLVNVSGSETVTATAFSTFPGVGDGNPIYFGDDGTGLDPIDAHIAEMGLIMPQGGSEDVDTMYGQLEAYIKEKYGA